MTSLGLPDDSRPVADQILGQVVLKKYFRGEFILQKDNLNQSVFILIEGSIRMTDGRFIEAELVPPDSFGERTLLTESASQYNFVAANECFVLVLDKYVFSQLTDLNNISARKIFRKLFSRFDALHREKTTHLLRNERETMEREIALVRENAKKGIDVALVSSIQYAKRLQESILPDWNALLQYFDGFLLFQNKDIITGDFYWYHIEHHHIYIAAADCTGHGVPGALTSMLCLHILNDLVRHYPGCSAAELLGRVNNEVCQTFHSGNPDGMDCALLRLNLITHEIEFSGANRPLYILRKQAETVDEFELLPSRTSIGHSIGPAPVFFNQYFSLQPTDTLYLFTDGYQDQIGGVNCKRIGSRRFKEALKSITELPLDQQHARLREEHFNWKGDTEQTDDLLVMGLRPFYDRNTYKPELNAK